MTKPRWCLGMAGTRRRTFGNLVGHVKGVSDMNSLAAWTNEQFDPRLSWADIAWVKEKWGGKLILKGILDKEDAIMAAKSGADAIIVPSRFEPCGLTQLYGLRYGTLPLVRRVGGLADSVVDCAVENLADRSATGFVFSRFDVADYLAAMRRACILYDRRDDWRQVQASAMAQQFDWDAAAERYAALYHEVAVAGDVS